MIASQAVKTWLQPVDNGVIGERRNDQVANNICQVEIYAHPKLLGQNQQEFKQIVALRSFPRVLGTRLSFSSFSPLFI